MINNVLKKIINHLKTDCKDLIAIYLFGSFGTKFENKASDIDIAILLPKKISRTYFWELAQKIASSVNREIDLVDLLQANTVLQKQIVTSGKLLYCKDKTKCAKFETTVLSCYLELNDFRKDILADITKKGEVFDDG